MKIAKIVTLLACISLGCASGRAAVKYWDIDGDATSGAGGASPSGTWNAGTTANWTQDPNGATPAETWTAGDSAIFSAGTDATGTYTVDVEGTQNAVGITFEDGAAALSGGTISMDVSPFPLVGTVNGSISSVLSGTVLTKSGTGTVTLTGNNNYIGQTLVTAGVLAAGHASALGTSTSNTVVSTGAAVALSGDISLAEQFSVAAPATGVATTGVLRSTAGSNSVDLINLTGTAGSAIRINVDSGTLFFRALYAPNRAALTLGGDGNTIIASSTPVTNVDGCLWGGEGGGITKEGTGTVTLNGQFTGRGTVNIAAGTFKMGAPGRFGNSGPVLPDVVANGILDLSGFDNDIDGLSGAGSVINAGTSILTICSNNSISSVHVASPNFSGVISGGTTIVKGGPPRTQTFSGNNTYSGNTIVKAGILKLAATGSISNSPLIQVNSGATFDVSEVVGFTLGENQTLAGKGTVAGAVTVAAGGNVSPGESAGLLTITDGLDLSAGGTNVWELAANSTSDAGTNYDQVVLTGGSLSLGGASTLSIRFTDSATAPDGSEPFWQTTRSWNIISASGAASNFASLENATYPAGNFTTAVDGTGIVLTFTPAPVTPAAPAPTITSIDGAGTSTVTVNYSNTVTGKDYVVQYLTNLTSTDWTSLSPVNASGNTASTVDATATGAERYYRVYYVAP